MIIIFYLVQHVLYVIERLWKEVNEDIDHFPTKNNFLLLAYTACNKKYCPEHFACSICETKMNEKSKFFDVDAKPVCKQCYGKIPSDIRKSLEQNQKKKPLSSILKQNTA
jgi:hypothetical protein